METKKLFIALILGIFLFSLVSASSTECGSIPGSPFKTNTSFQITNYCADGGCTFMNITNIQYPNGTIITLNKAMTQNGQNFNYSYSANQLGTYTVHYLADPLGYVVSDCDTFQVTPNGKIFTTQNAIAYVGFLIVLFFLFILDIWGAIKIPWKHTKNEEGKIITINDFRYIKVFLFSMAYMLMMFLFGLSYKLFNEANMEGFNNFFYFVYQVFQSLLIPIIIGTTITFVVIFLSNLKLKKMSKLGL